MGNSNALRFKRNDMTGVMSVTKDMIVRYLTEQIQAVDDIGDGQIIIGRYNEGGEVKSLIGVSHNGRTSAGNKAGVTIIDPEGGVNEERVNDIVEEYVDEKVGSLKAEDIDFSFTDPNRRETNVGDAINALENGILATKGEYIQSVSGKDAVNANVTVGQDGKRNGEVSLRINSGDKILSQDSNGLSARVELSYDKDTHTLSIKGKNGAVIGNGVDMGEFTKDGMLENVELIVPTKENPVVIHGIKVDSGMYLKFTWNVTGENKPLYVDMTEWMGEILKIEYKAGNGVAIDGEHRISIDLSPDSATVKYLYINGAGQLAFREDEISKLIDEKWTGGFYPNYLKELSTYFLPLSGGTMGGNIHMSGSNGVTFGGTVADQDEHRKRGDVKISKADDGGIDFSVNDGDGYFETKAGMDGEGELYMYRDGKKELVDETYLRKEDYNDGGKSYRWENDQTQDEGKGYKVAETVDGCVLSVIMTLGEVSEDGTLVASDTLEDIVWVPAKGSIEPAYCSKHEDLFVAGNGKLCTADGLNVKSCEVKVLHGTGTVPASATETAVSSGYQPVYPTRPVLHNAKNATQTEISQEFPLYGVFEATEKCVVDVTVKSGGRSFSDTIHIQRHYMPGDGSWNPYAHFTAYCEKNYGLFKWRVVDKSKVCVYICDFAEGKYLPDSVSFRAVTEEKRGCVKPIFGEIDETKDDFYPPMLTASDLTYVPTVHVSGTRNFMEAVYLLNQKIYTPSGETPRGRIILDSGILVNWLCTHTINDKTYYRELGVTTDDEKRTIDFKNSLDGITIEGCVDKWNIINVHGVWVHSETGVFSKEAAFLTTIKADNMSFKNITFRKQSRTSVTGKINESRTDITVNEPEYKIQRFEEIPQATFVDQNRAMFEVGESLTLDGCSIDIQGLMKKGADGSYGNETEYSFDNPLVKVCGKDGADNATVRLTNCTFNSPFVKPDDGDYCVDDAIKISAGVKPGSTVSSVDVIIDGCNIISDDHKRSNDSIVRVVKATERVEAQSAGGEKEYRYDDVEPSAACVYNIHRDTMKVENSLDGVRVVPLPDESAKGPKILSENNSIVVTNNQDTNEVNIEVYEPGSKVVYADNLLQFLKGVKYINDNGKSGIIKVTGDIRFVDAMNDDWSSAEKTAFDEAGLQLTENTQTIGVYQNIIVKEIDFGDKLDGIQIEGVTPKAVFRTMPVRLTYKDADGNIKLYRRNNDATGNPVSTYGTIKANSLNFRNISLMRGNNATSNENVTFEGKKYNDPYNKGTSGVDRRVFVINDNPFFKFAVSCKFENCDIYSQNTTYNNNNQVPLDFNWFSTDETDWKKFYPYDKGCILAQSDYTKTNADGDPIGKTIKIENCRLISFCAYYGDATTSIQDEIGLDILLDCPQSVQDEVGIDVMADGVNRSRNLSPQVILTNCRVQQGSFAHNTRLHIECNKKNMNSNRTVRLNLYKGNVRTIAEELQTIRNNGIIVNEMD